MGTINLSLSNVFLNSNEKRRLFPENDNSCFRNIFTPGEMAKIHALTGTLVWQGYLHTAVYKKGDNISCVLIERKMEKRPLVLAVVKQEQAENPPQYMVNFGLGYPPTATINFDEVLHLGRMHLNRVFSGPGRVPSLI